MSATITIEKGIPIPSVRGPSKWSEVLSSMKKGDSVHIPHEEALQLINYMRNNGVRPVMRQTTQRGTPISNQMARVWHNGVLTQEEKETKRKKAHARVKLMRMRAKRL